MLKIFEITSLRFIYIYGFRIGAFNPNQSFSLYKCTKWTGLNQMDHSGPTNRSRQNRTEWSE